MTIEEFQARVAHWEGARGLNYSDALSEALVEALCEAIASERERCARIAEEWGKSARMGSEAIAMKALAHEIRDGSMKGPKA